jgi:hypothetical protein
MNQAGHSLTTPLRRKSRHIQDIHKLSGVTWFGHCVTHIVTALREMPLPGKLQLLEDLSAFCDRQSAELRRHDRGRS